MRGSLRQRSKGSWEIRFDGPSDRPGRRKFLSETVRGTRRDAERVLRERLAAIDTGAYVEKRRATVADFLEEWMDTYVATNTSPRTQQGYREKTTNYILPSIGSVQLQQLSAQAIQRMYADMLQRGLSKRTVLHTHRILREALKSGVQWGHLIRNVADATTPPRPDSKEIQPWDRATLNRFLEAASSSQFLPLYHLANLTGMRRSELTGLRWVDIDFPGLRLSVANTLQRIVGQGLVNGQPKSRRSRRSISLSAGAIEVLHAVRGHQMESKLAAGSLWHDTGYVFALGDGHPVDPDRISRDFAKIVKKAGLPHLTLIPS